VIGDRVKIGNNASVFGATISDEAMICPGAMLLQDPATRAATPGGTRKGPSDWTRRPVTVGAGRDHWRGCRHHARRRAAHALVAGNPARPCGWVCACGTTLDASLRCPACSRAYEHGEQGLAAIPGEGEPT
jgi:hypothetical protein